MTTGLIAEEDFADTASGRPLATISTLVSLFLLLLVFFVLLFSIAEVHRDRAVEVLSSVDAAFGGLPSRLGLVTKQQSTVSPALANEDFVKQISMLVTGFTGVMPQPETPAGSRAAAGLLRIDLPTGALFQPGKPALTDRAKQLLPQLAVLMQARPAPHRHYRLTLVASPADAAGRALLTGQVALFADALFAAGCPADALQVGLAIIVSGQTVMAFAATEEAAATE